MIDDKTLSRYLDDLPALYRQEATGARPDFLGRFLLAFEHVLTGVGDTCDQGLEEILDGIVDEAGRIRLAGSYRYFTPGPGEPEELRAPAEFLAWLSGWVALTLRDDWKDEERRRILARVVSFYRDRGTPDGLKQVLATFAGVSPGAITFAEDRKPFQLGVLSTLGKDMLLGGEPPHHFTICVRIPTMANLARQRAVLRAIIDMEKPAHTHYELRLQGLTTMQVGMTSTVGENTVLSVLPGNS